MTTGGRDWRVATLLAKTTVIDTARFATSPRQREDEIAALRSQRQQGKPAMTMGPAGVSLVREWTALPSKEKRSPAPDASAIHHGLQHDNSNKINPPVDILEHMCYYAVIQVGTGTQAETFANTHLNKYGLHQQG